MGPARVLRQDQCLQGLPEMLTEAPTGILTRHVRIRPLVVAGLNYCFQNGGHF